MNSVLEVRDAQVTYSVPGGTIRAVDGVSFDIRPGETVAVVGESGCGKTTLAKAILGLEPVTQGSISALGANVTNDLKGLAKRVGIVWTRLRHRRNRRNCPGAAGPP